MSMNARAPQQLALVLEAPPLVSATPATQPAREVEAPVEAPPDGVCFITDEELDWIFGPRAEASADVCTGRVEGAES